MKNKLKEPPRVAVKFTNMVLVLGIVLAFLIVIRYLYALFYPLDGPYPDFMLPAIYQYYFKIIIACLIIATLLGLGLKKLSNNLKASLSLSFFTVGIVVYGFETFLEFSTKTSQKEIIAKQMGVSYDSRTTIEVLNDLRDSGFEALPNVRSAFLVKSNGLTSDKGRIYPLGTISNTTTIFSNESGYYPVIETDEHGFNNPKGLYEENKVDIVLTGDSFTEGYSVHSNETISAVLRQSDFNVISVGKGNNGPLIELAALKEYAEPLKPKIVLWLYGINDMFDLGSEMKSSLLSKYLNEDDYSQNLISRQKEIDGVLINYVQVEWEKKKNKEKERVENNTNWTTNINEVIYNNRIIKILKLSNLRIKITLTPNAYSVSIPTPIFRDVLQKSKQMVSNWNGKIYFVYLPAFTRYSTGNKDPHRDFVMQTATELDIPIIDIHNEVFDPHLDPLSLFPFRVSSHYNAEGYKLVAEAIGRRLEADGYVPIKSKK